MAEDSVDVLAVWDRTIAVLAAIANGYSGNPEHQKAVDEARAARAAVAELIEAIRSERQVRDDAAIGRATTLAVIEATQRTGAALARVGGA